MRDFAAAMGAPRAPCLVQTPTSLPSIDVNYLASLLDVQQRFLATPPYKLFVLAPGKEYSAVPEHGALRCFLSFR